MVLHMMLQVQAVVAEVQKAPLAPGETVGSTTDDDDGDGGDVEDDV